MPAAELPHEAYEIVDIEIRQGSWGDYAVLELQNGTRTNAGSYVKRFILRFAILHTYLT